MGLSYVFFPSEALTGHSFDGPMDLVRIAQRLKALFPEARILIVIRKQGDLLESLYKQFVFSGGMLNFPNFLNCKTRHSRFDINFLKYDNVIAAYRKLFGPEQVEVLPYEMLRLDQQRFADRVCDFAGIPHVQLAPADKEYVRKGYSALYCSMAFRLNYFRKSAYSHRGFYVLPTGKESFIQKMFTPFTYAEIIAKMARKIFGERELMTPEEKIELAEKFVGCNEILKGWYPLLSEYGYLSTQKTRVGL